MIDLFLLFFAIAALLCFLLINAKMVFYYEDEGDASKDFVGLRFVVIASFTVAYLVIFLLPIDVRNSRNDGGLHMEAFWIIAFISVILLILLVLPGGMFWLEIQGDWKIVFGGGRDGSSAGAGADSYDVGGAGAGGGGNGGNNASTLSKAGRAKQFLTRRSPGRRLLLHMLFFFFFMFMFLAISFAFLATARLPVEDYSCGNWQDAGARTRAAHVCVTSAEKFLEINVRFDIYLMAVFCFLGWWLFVVFGGVGLTALPMDLLLEYQDRPKPISASQYASKKILYAQTAQALLQRATALQDEEQDLKAVLAGGNRFTRTNKRKRALKMEFNKFKQSVFLLEKEFEHMEQCVKYKQENPLVTVGKVVFGVLFALVSFLWVLHILFYLLITDANDQPVSLFLNDFLSAFEAAGLFVLAAVLFAVFNLHLLFCTVKGCLKVGMRAFCLFSIHPMKKGETPLNSLMFNGILVNFTSCAIVQFAQLAFQDYARATTADVVFNAQIKYLKFYRIFFENNVFVITLLVWCFVSLLYLLMFPRDTPALKLGDAKSTKEFEAVIGKHSAIENGGGAGGGNAGAAAGGSRSGSKEVGGGSKGATRDNLNFSAI